jgi:hypothetical protein
MKYHKHTIVPKIEDLGYEDKKMNKVYLIFDQDGNYITVAWTMNNAKQYIDSGYDATYLC